MCTCKRNNCDINSCLCACHRAKEVLNMGESQKTRENKISELEDHYSNVLFGMDDEQLDQEYSDRIGEL